MKNLLICLTLAASTLLFMAGKSPEHRNQSVNAVLGDISFQKKFGHKPDALTDNTLRISTHLEYVEDLLRAKDVYHLSAAQQAKRAHMLDLLHAYRTAGRFPKNYDYADRKPCFIDREGTICAVGYLVEQTAGRPAAASINAAHQYDELLAMNSPLLDSWVASSGLTKEECAMIQPTYGPSPSYNVNNITPAYGISSAVFTGVNLSLDAMNGLQALRGSRSNAMPVIGMLTGAGQIVLGAASFPEEQYGWNGSYTNESQKILSMVNIAVGTSTMMLSAWNLLSGRKTKVRPSTWGVSSYSTPGNNTGMALQWTRRF